MEDKLEKLEQNERSMKQFKEGCGKKKIKKTLKNNKYKSRKVQDSMR